MVRIASGASRGFNPREQLELFVTRAEEMQASRLLVNGFNPSFSMKWDRMSGTRFESEEPDADDLRSFLMIFRRFISDREQLHLFKIYNICLKHLMSGTLKDNLFEAREAWKNELKRGGIHLTFNDRDIRPEYLTDLWINGYYFHDDAEKLRKLMSLLPHENMLVKHIFLDHVIGATRQVLYVAFIIRAAFREGLFQGL